MNWGCVSEKTWRKQWKSICINGKKNYLIKKKILLQYKIV